VSEQKTAERTEDGGGMASGQPTGEQHTARVTSKAWRGKWATHGRELMHKDTAERTEDGGGTASG